MNKDQIALQLYSVRDHTAQDMIGTLEKLAAQGYKAVEFAGFGNASAKELRAALDRLGMRAVGAHIGLDAILKQGESMIADLKLLGCEYAVVAYIAEDRRGGPEKLAEIISILNRSGELCREAGLRFGYHNHDFEFGPGASGQGTMIFDTLVAETDPALVDFELDLYWLRYAGLDVIDMLGRMAGRVPLVHVKDMEAGASREAAPVGEGIFEWPAVLRACQAAGVEWYIIEQDNPAEPLPMVERSLRNLEKFAS